MKNSREKKTGNNFLLEANDNQAQIIYIWKQDDQVAQYKCEHLDRDHSAHRVYLNFRTARGRLIVGKSFWFVCVCVCFLFFYVFFLTGVSFALCNFN